MSKEAADYFLSSKFTERLGSNRQIFSVISWLDSDLLEATKNEKIVLIEGSPGSGKTWEMKKYAKLMTEKESRKFVTFVDLREFSLDSQISENFQEFMVKTILEPTKTEEFLEYYKNGQVCIFLDSIDGIDQESIDFVLKMVLTFCANGGNQIFLAARNELEIDKRLKLNNIYYFHSYNHYSWDPRTYEKSKEEIDDTKNVEELLNHAIAFFSFIPDERTKIIGGPLAYQMYVELALADKKPCKSFSMHEYIQHFFSGKGIISRNFDDFDMFEFFKNYIDLKIGNQDKRKLQLNAVELLFPTIFKSKESEIPEIQGFLTRKNSRSIFVHDTFAEFLVVEFVIESYSKNFDPRALNCISKIIQNPQHDFMRFFLNKAFSNTDFTKLAPKFAVYFKDFENFVELFTKNLKSYKNLSNLVTEILKTSGFEKSQNVLALNIDKIETINNAEDLRDILDNLAESHLESSTFCYVLEYILASKSQELVKDAILVNLPSKYSNFFVTICNSQEITAERFKDCFQVNQKFVKYSDLRDILLAPITADEKSYTNNGMYGIFYACRESKNIKKFEIVFEELKKFLPVEDFRALLKHRSVSSVVAIAASAEDLEFIDKFWKQLSDIFPNPDELFSLIVCETINGRWDTYETVMENLTWNTSKEAVELTLKIFRKIFSKSQYQKILTSKSGFYTIMEQISRNDTRRIPIFEHIHYLRDSCESLDEYIELVVGCGYRYIKDFGGLAEKLELSANKEQMRKFLGNFENNIFKYAELFHFFTEKLENLFKIYRKYFDSEEILTIIKHVHLDGMNLLIRAKFYCISALKCVWGEVLLCLENDKEVLATRIKECQEVVDKQYEFSILKDGIELLKLDWIKEKNSQIFKSQPEKFKNQIQQEKLFSSPLDFENLAVSVDLEIHEISWQFLREKYQNIDDLLDILTRHTNFFHLVVGSDEIEILNFTFEIVMEIFSKEQFYKILRAKEREGKNLLQTAACKAKKLDIHEKLLKLMESLEIEELFIETDGKGNNLIMDVIEFGTLEIFEFYFAKIETMDKNKMLDMLQKANQNLENILHFCIKLDDPQLLKPFFQKIHGFCGSEIFMKLLKKVYTRHPTILEELGLNSLYHLWKCEKSEIHQAFWQFLAESSDDMEEIKNFIVEPYNRYIYVYMMIQYRSLETIQQTLSYFEKIFSTKQYEQILFDTNPDSHGTLMESAAKNELDVLKYIFEMSLDYYKSENIGKIYKGLFENLFVSLVRQVPHYDPGKQILLRYIENFRFLADQLEKHATSEQIRKFLDTKQFDHQEHLLSSVLFCRETSEFFKISWNLIKKCYDKEELLKLVMEENVLKFTMNGNSSDTFEFAFDEFEKLFDKQKIFEYLSRKEEGKNVIRENIYSPEMKELIDKIFTKYGIKD